MSNCTDFCTAAKCAELEARIGALEQALELLEASFEAHTSQWIPNAHIYEPRIDLTISQTANENEYEFFVFIDDIYSDNAFLTLSPLTSEPPVIEFEIYNFGNDKTTNSAEYELEIGINGNYISSYLTINFPPLDLYLGHKYRPETNNLELYIYDNFWYYNLYTETTIDLDTWNSQHVPSNLNVDLVYAGGFLQVAVADGESSDLATVEIDAEIINNINNYYDSGGGGGVSCEQKIEECCDLLAGLINGVSAQITDTQSILSAENTEIKNEITIDISGEIPTEFICSDGENELPKFTALPYTEKGLSGLHQLLKATNDNLFTTFKAICEATVEIAAPSWWQVRLGGNVPQICCTFRRNGTRTYHSLTIPHPINTNRPIEPLLGEYIKGNFQGTIVLKDNSKFIVNANSTAEADRVCNQAASLIDPAYLPNPFKVWLTERRGEAVQTDLMIPTSIFYYSNGQRNTKPDWRVGLSKLTSN